MEKYQDLKMETAMYLRFSSSAMSMMKKSMLIIIVGLIIAALGALMWAHDDRLAVLWRQFE